MTKPTESIYSLSLGGYHDIKTEYPQTQERTLNHSLLCLGPVDDDDADDEDEEEDGDHHHRRDGDDDGDDEDCADNDDGDYNDGDDNGDGESRNEVPLVETNCFTD